MAGTATHELQALEFQCRVVVRSCILHCILSKVDRLTGYLSQEKIADATPNGWNIQIKDFDLGQSAPALTDVRVLNDIQKPGKLAAMDMVLAFDSGM